VIFCLECSPFLLDYHFEVLEERTTRVQMQQNRNSTLRLEAIFEHITSLHSPVTKHGNSKQIPKSKQIIPEIGPNGPRAIFKRLNKLSSILY